MKVSSLMKNNSNDRQTKASIDKNVYFFLDGYENYSSKVGPIGTYNELAYVPISDGFS
jgi:hypothetical protein